MDVVGTLQKISAELSSPDKANLHKELSAYLNYLLLNDFHALVQILYRMDVPEEKLKIVLKENQGADAGDLLAELIIERQIQKINLRTANPFLGNIPDEESW